MKYRKIKIVIEATQWFKNGDHPNDYSTPRQGIANGNIKEWSLNEAKRLNWEGEIVRRFRRPDVSDNQICANCGEIMMSHGWMDTLEGGHIVCVGDWIITGIKGEHYPCKPDIFEKTYEKA